MRALTPGRPRGHSLRARRRRPGWGSGSRPRGGVLWWAGTTRAGVPPVSGTAPGGTVVRPLVQAGRIDAPAPEARPGHAAGACALFASSVEAAGTGCGDQHGIVVRSHHLADAGGPAATTTRRSGSRTGPRLARRRVTDDGRRATGRAGQRASATGDAGDTGDVTTVPAQAGDRPGCTRTPGRRDRPSPSPPTPSSRPRRSGRRPRSLRCWNCSRLSPTGRGRRPGRELRAAPCRATRAGRAVRRDEWTPEAFRRLPSSSMVSAAPDAGRCLVRLRDGGAGGGGGAALGTALARPEPVVAAYAVPPRGADGAPRRHPASGQPLVVRTGRRLRRDSCRGGVRGRLSRRAGSTAGAAGPGGSCSGN
ncbi:hypothetical protein J2S52_003575 [Streptomyces sp. DSM 41037]|nr:hypothetical protein [Streptomyces sp. DSM 41037]